MPIFVAVIKSTIAFFLAFFFLAGSTLLPLGDFSLMSDLPTMYRSYAKVVADEPDIIDFIGDYLLNGKELLGHNQRDATQKSSGSIQFQHQASSLIFLAAKFNIPTIIVFETRKYYGGNSIKGRHTDYHADLLRPPLSC